MSVQDCWCLPLSDTAVVIAVMCMKLHLETGPRGPLASRHPWCQPVTVPTVHRSHVWGSNFSISQAICCFWRLLLLKNKLYFFSLLPNWTGSCPGLPFHSFLLPVFQSFISPYVRHKIHFSPCPLKNLSITHLTFTFFPPLSQGQFGYCVTSNKSLNLSCSDQSLRTNAQQVAVGTLHIAMVVTLKEKQRLHSHLQHEMSVALTNPLNDFAIKFGCILTHTLESFQQGRETSAHIKRMASLMQSDVWAQEDAVNWFVQCPKCERSVMKCKEVCDVGGRTVTHWRTLTIKGNDSSTIFLSKHLSQNIPSGQLQGP